MKYKLKSRLPGEISTTSDMQMTIYALMYSFPNLEPVHCFMSCSNCCFLTCIQVSQEAGQVVWYFHFFKNFPQFVVIHIVKGFGIVNKAKVDVFLNSLDFSMIQRMLAIWSLVPSSPRNWNFSFLFRGRGFTFLKLFIYLFDLAGSWLRHAGSNLVAAGGLWVVASGI